MLPAAVLALVLVLLHMLVLVVACGTSSHIDIAMAHCIEMTSSTLAGLSRMFRATSTFCGICFIRNVVLNSLKPNTERRTKRRLGNPEDSSSSSSSNSNSILISTIP